VLTDGDRGRYPLIDVGGEIVAFVLESGAEIAAHAAPRTR
jgi:hypothetical protein